MAASLLVDGQSLSNASLTGGYHVRQILLVSNAAGVISDARSFTGQAVFDGRGRFVFSGQAFVMAAAPVALTGSGTYAVEANGQVRFTNPLRTTATMTAWLSDTALLGSTPETGGGVFDMLVASPVSTTSTPATLNGTWRVAGVDFRRGLVSLARTTFFDLTATGGVFASANINGQAANLGVRPVTQTQTGATYALNPDGSGSANFPAPGGAAADERLVSGAKTLMLSKDGNLIVMGSAEAGGHDLLVGVRALPAAATPESFKDLFFTAGIKLDNGRFNAHAGSANATGTGVLFMSRRTRAPDGVTHFTGINRYTLQASGTGQLELNSVAVGSGGAAFVSSGVALANSNNYELIIGLRAPAAPAPAGVFLNPYGVVNAASFAPVGNPVSPGQFVTLFGSGLAPSTLTAAAVPFPPVLNNVQVLVNNQPAPLYLVSPGQLSFLIPYGTQAGTASIAVRNGGASSNEIRIPVAATSPGIFSVPPAGFGPGAILKTNFTLVTASNPARRGETVQIFLTGLGSVSPGIPDGSAAPANPLSLVTGTVNVYIGGVPATVSFKGLAPNLAGLYQLNVVIPAGAPSGANVPVGVETAEAFHDQVDIAIQP